MKRLLLLIAIAFLPACSTTSPVVDVAVTYGVAKVVENSSAAAKPGRVRDLREAAAGLRALAQGTVSRAAVDALLKRVFHGDAELAAIHALIVSYFPDEDVPVHHDEALAATARRLALLIESGLPAVPAK